MFSPDQPIQHSKDDELNRTSFAHSFAEAIINYKEKESLVLGLFGAWGSGKTSILNLALEHIASCSQEKSEEEKPIIVRFNPWNYSEQNQLFFQFFRELSVTLKRTDYASGAKVIGKKIETYSRLFDPLVLIPTAGPIFIILSMLLRSFGSVIRGWGEVKSKDLETLRNELNELLDKQKNKIIIVIDDIDRLSDIEIRQVFQLIKSVGDFHNTVYILTFDKNVVVTALNKLQEEQGLEYLEKVIQVPFEVPLISKRQVERLLQSELDELIRELPQEKLDPIRWGNVYYGALRHFFANIRDVKRYINYLKFGFNLVKEELNVVDFLAVTAIQVFIPATYYGVRDNKDLFSGIFESSGGDNELIKGQARKRCDEIINSSTIYPQEKLKELLTMLFPKLEAVYSNNYYGYEFLGEWRGEHRVCSPDIFDTFFRLSIQEGDISRKEIEAILSLAINPNAFSEALLKLNEEGKIVLFLERLEDYTRSQIPLENVEPIITALMDIGDLFPEGDTGSPATHTPMRILRVSYQLSHRFDSHNERFRIFKNAIEKASKSLYTMVHEVGVQGQQHGEYDAKGKPEPKERLTVNAEQLEKLKKLVCKKIEVWARDGRLAESKNLPNILFSWQEWGTLERVNKFVNEMIQDDDGLINFITSFLSAVKSRGLESYVGTIHWRIDLKFIGRFVNVKEIEPRIRNIASTSNFKKLDDRKKLAINTFLDTIDGKIKDPFQDRD